MPDTWVVVKPIPNCDINHAHGRAYADARLPGIGSWAYVCEPCFKQFGCTLGLGNGQQLVSSPPPGDRRKRAA